MTGKSKGLSHCVDLVQVQRAMGGEKYGDQANVGATNSAYCVTLRHL